MQFWCSKPHHLHGSFPTILQSLVAPSPPPARFACPFSILPSTQPQRTLGGVPFASNCLGRVFMTLQVEKEESKALHGASMELEPFLTISIPQHSVLGFEEDYCKEAANWPPTLTTTSDHHHIEQFVDSAHFLARKWLPRQVITRLESFIHDPSQPSALIIRGLPIETDLPPTGTAGVKQKLGSYMSEAWLVGIGRILGQPYIFSNLVKGPSLESLIFNLFPTPEKAEEVSSLGSLRLIDFHVDFFHLVPQCFPAAIVFLGLRGDPSKKARTHICDFRELYRSLDAADIKILREQKISWGMSGTGGFSRYLIEGPEENPRFKIFEEYVGGMPGFDKVVSGNPEAVAAYRRVKDIAHEIGMQSGVWLDAGDMLIVNQRRVAHARTPFEPKYDGKDRWLQRVYVNEGTIWEPVGEVPWPERRLPAKVALE